jgi:hypothetical protein
MLLPRFMNGRPPHARPYSDGFHFQRALGAPVLGPLELNGINPPVAQDGLRRVQHLRERGDSGSREFDD